MEFKGTPAPWRCHDKRPNCSGYSIFGNDGQYIGFVGDSDELTPIDANAHLIAAAPELLEQLIRLRNKIASYKPDDDDDLDIVDAVIAKALGQQ
ncbi:hypothetical protein U2T78_004345 [Providencia stuartii]|uniref:hypothetical protein n=1 Tax=Providencia TaxID=586 RepID=UPI001A317A8C|nr:MULTISPECIES: hypothetical protein [Providencia]EMA3643527.1 hypothetical protein [Providencia stuartii]MBW3103228.1 hypothetical protein [Providencia stuartii]MCB5219871.1 hypothetical protein [Providencia stuartii]MDE8745571.1 hypothetical protein [Providencia thailandensis]MDE8764246.1 hypothetical protein [Providencia thailandensis]